jgi:hypothetical protein
MKYFRRRRRFSPGREGSGVPVSRDDDPLSGVANLFDIGLVFIVGLIMTFFSAYHLQDLFDRNSEFTIMKQKPDGEMEIIVKEGTRIEARRVTAERAVGRGRRLGVAYRLEDGTMIYVPEQEEIGDRQRTK